MNNLPYLFTERQAAVQLGVSINTMRGIRTRREIRFRTIGKRIKYTEADLHAYIEGPPWSDSKSETTGSPKDPIQSIGIESGSIVPLNKHVVSLLAQKTFGKHKSD